MDNREPMRFVDLVAGSLASETATIAFLQGTGFGGARVREWYRTLRVGAYAMDVLTLIIGTYVAVRVVPDELWMQLLAAVAVQLAHDVLFGAFIRTRAAKGPLMDLFRRYAAEMRWHVLWADALMMLLTVLGMHAVSYLTANDAALVACVAAYVGLVLVHSFPKWQVRSTGT